MSDSLKRLGRRVRQFRTEKGISQEKLAERSGISTKYLSDMERGAANSSIQILERVAENLGVTVTDLLNNDHEVGRDALEAEIKAFLETAEDDKIKTLYRIMKSIL